MASKYCPTGFNFLFRYVQKSKARREARYDGYYGETRGKKCLLSRHLPLKLLLSPLRSGGGQLRINDHCLPPCHEHLEKRKKIYGACKLFLDC
ncbi:hypothetical protein AVEN_263171-1, partial [Araneus ventricosus]